VSFQARQGVHRARRAVGLLEAWPVRCRERQDVQREQSAVSAAASRRAAYGSAAPQAPVLRREPVQRALWLRAPEHGPAADAEPQREVVLQPAQLVVLEQVPAWPRVAQAESPVEAVARPADGLAVEPQQVVLPDVQVLPAGVRLAARVDV
jgi:hypothetical protein